MGRFTTAALAVVFGLNSVAWAQQVDPVPRPRNLADDSGRLADLIAEQDPAFAANEADADDPDPVEEMLATEDLDDLVAPVALYPDALLAQVLVAATFPLEIVKADRLLAASGDMTDDELSQAIADEAWDPSVLVLLSGFPTVIQRMAEDLEWTEDLGNAMLRQDADVLAAVQRMRTEARSSGALESNEAQVVEEEDEQIYIRPADPQVVYVPSYDPAVAFAPAAVTTQPVTTQQPGILSNPLFAGAVAFGGALLVQELFGDDDDEDDGWDDYWRRPEPIDWRQRQFYPRPRQVALRDRQLAWAAERDRYWDRAERRWQRDAAQARLREDERRDALRWMQTQSERRADRLAALREREREARELRQRQQRAVARQREETREAEQRAARARAATREERALTEDSEARAQNARRNLRDARSEASDAEAKAKAREAKARQAERDAAKAKQEARDARAVRREADEAREQDEARAEAERRRQAREARQAEKAQAEKAAADQQKATAAKTREARKAKQAEDEAAERKARSAAAREQKARSEAEPQRKVRAQRKETENAGSGDGQQKAAEPAPKPKAAAGDKPKAQAQGQARKARPPCEEGEKGKACRQQQN